jgi:hypothetical protein
VTPFLGACDIALAVKLITSAARRMRHPSSSHSYREGDMTLTTAQLSRSIVVILKAATYLGAGRATRTRPVTGEEAEAWLRHKEEQRTKLKDEANAPSWHPL